MTTISAAATEPRVLFFPPDPSTHNRCTIGGMVGNNSCGVHSVMAGKTVETWRNWRSSFYDGTVLRVGTDEEEALPGILAAGGSRGQV